jgi:hypothetical protein
MKLKTVFAAAALLTLGVSTSAFATTVSIGAVPIAPANPSYTQFSHLTAGIFGDELDFSVTAGSLASSANNISVMLHGQDISDITGLSYTLYQVGNSTALGTYDGDNSTYYSPLTVAGDYKFVITGNAVGTAGGSYGVSLQTVSAVPEPATYGMLLGGLALVGAIARRKGAKKAV